MPEVSWPLTTVIGDAAVQRAVERAVAREGDDREQLGRDGFAARARRLETDAAADLRRLLDDLGIRADLDAWAPDGDAMIRIARVAFVRLYDAGVLRRSDAVLDSCPSCETVVDDADADEVELETAQIRVAIELLDGVLELDTADPELWVGASAVAIPASLDVTDERVLLPLLDAEVPLIAVEGLEAPVVVVPGHDRWSYDLARQLGLPIVEVLDGEGLVRQPSALEGLGRFAARAAAIELLSAGGHVVAHFEAMRKVKRCYRCATVLVPLVGRHWILDLHELVEPVVELVKMGAMTFDPPGVEADVIALADRAGSWCVSQQLWSGHRIPVATCLDCGQTKVSVERDDSCGSCMGTLEPASDVFDARFISALTPLAVTGWPFDMEEPGSVATTLSVGRVGLETWALPMAALGLRLGGTIPFSHVILHQTPVGMTEPGLRPTTEVIEFAQRAGRRLTRAALLAGDLDIERASEALSAVDTPSHGTQALDGCMEQYEKALSALQAGGALAMLVNLAREGIVEGANDELATLIGPLLGDDDPSQHSQQSTQLTVAEAEMETE